MGDENKRKAAHKSLELLLVTVEKHPNPPMTFEQALTYQERCDAYMLKCETATDNLIGVCADDAAVAVQTAAMATVEQTYVTVKAKLSKLMKDLNPGSAGGGGFGGGSGGVKVKLPVIEPPTFDGNIINWPSYKDLFLAAVDSNNKLAPSQKLQYLKSSLKDEPANLIKAIQITDANYDEAWNILKERYDNTREILFVTITKLLNHRSLQIENAIDLQKLIDNAYECLSALKVLQQPVDSWDSIMVVLYTSKLDPTTKREWAIRQTTTTFPTFKEFTSFVNNHIRGLQATASTQTQRRNNQERNLRVHHATTSHIVCVFCRGGHYSHYCRDFKSKAPADRLATVNQLNLCSNCLRGDHKTDKCNNKGTCFKCHQRHHILLHSNATPPPTTSQEVASGSSSLQLYHIRAETEVLLPTAVCYIRDGRGGLQTCRIFLDQGSQGTLITEECVQRLHLPRQYSFSVLTGAFFSNSGRTKGMVSLTVSSFYSDFTYEINAHITSRFTGNLPVARINPLSWPHLQNLKLADPAFNVPAPVDILLGAEYVALFKLGGRHLGGPNAPIAEETSLGWILSGRVNTVAPALQIHSLSLDSIVRRFWETEEPPTAKILTMEEKLCESHFLSTFKRDENGRFVVSVPFNERKSELGLSRDIAFRRFLQVERRLQRNPQHGQQYIDFMKEYEALGHMELLQHAACGERVGKTNYLPHHFVVNSNSTTTKLRVVFDGSAKTSTGLSFNDTVRVGPTIQDDIFDLLIRFRFFKYVLKADVTKMFRQFYLPTEDADFHRILFRESPNQPIREYRLLTVTYGTGYAPYVSTRCLKQLAIEVECFLPLASHAIHNDFYVDDLMTGRNDLSTLFQLYEELTLATSSAKLELRKWASNSPEMLSHIPPELRETDPMSFDTDPDQTIKPLGLQWNPATDSFTFKYVKLPHHSKLTKRTLLSDLSRIYDPLGFVSCVTIRAKLQLQELWRLNLDWDSEVPDSVAQAWWHYQDDLKNIASLQIPRLVLPDNASVELHGFCDASERAYGAVVYLRATTTNGISSSLLTAKGKVSPLRQVSLPRLELNSALMLAELISHIQENIKLECKIVCWSDSEIALHWIAAQPRRWQTYVANRVAKIQELTPTECWRHVPGVQNPADLVSRGITCQQLVDNPFWWNGPEWLSQPNVPIFPFVPAAQNLEERRQVVLVNHLQMDSSILQRFSTLTRMKRVTALLLRWRNRSYRGPLTVQELQQALYLWIRQAQRSSFEKELTSLTANQRLPHNSKLKQLFPYVDRDGILRVGGRLDKADVPESRKHQIILPSDSHLTDLLISHTHRINFHGGFQLTWSLLQTEFWIIHGRDKVRNFIRKCVVCRRHHAAVSEQLMGSLPIARVNPSRPFLHTGVDYAGPFTLRNPMGRVPLTYKGYLCIFVCLSTKAVHLEAVSGLSTDDFIATLRRFVSRRGLCAHIYSDCGTNFAGAEKELRTFLRTPSTHQQITNEMASSGISFHFNPPSSPHKGGLWEAAVKSAKHHLRRVMGSSILTYEQFSTFLCQIEAILNSRPLHPLSADPTDFAALTPGHFLIGEPLLAVPDANYLEIHPNRLNQYQLQQQRVQHFWRRWSQEYLNTLQQRNKWYTAKDNLQPNELVLLKEETNPLQWRMGRVLETFKDDKNLVRTVKIKTSTRELIRPIVKLIPLLNEQNND